MLFREPQKLTNLFTFFLAIRGREWQKRHKKLRKIPIGRVNRFDEHRRTNQKPSLGPLREMRCEVVPTEAGGVPVANVNKSSTHSPAVPMHQNGSYVGIAKSENILAYPRQRR